MRLGSRTTRSRPELTPPPSTASPPARFTRWADRLDGRHPKKFSPNIKYPVGHENLEWLGGQFGVLSDAFVHFTPEFMLGQHWKAEAHEGGTAVALAYFTVEKAVARWACVVQAGIYARILDLFDECYDGAFNADAGWSKARREVERMGAELTAQLPKLADDEVKGVRRRAS